MCLPIEEHFLAEVWTYFKYLCTCSSLVYHLKFWYILRGSCSLCIFLLAKMVVCLNFLFWRIGKWNIKGQDTDNSPAFNSRLDHTVADAYSFMVCDDNVWGWLLSVAMSLWALIPLEPTFFFCEIRVHLGSAFGCAPINTGLSDPCELGCLEICGWSGLWEIKSVTCYCRQLYHNDSHKCTKIHLTNQQMSCLYYFSLKACFKVCFIPIFHAGYMIHH